MKTITLTSNSKSRFKSWKTHLQLESQGLSHDTHLQLRSRGTWTCSIPLVPFFCCKSMMAREKWENRGNEGLNIWVSESIIFWEWFWEHTAYDFGQVTYLHCFPIYKWNDENDSVRHDIISSNDELSRWWKWLHTPYPVITGYPRGKSLKWTRAPSTQHHFSKYVLWLAQDFRV